MTDTIEVMEKPIKLILSTAIMGQMWPEQWREILDFSDQTLEEQGINARTGLELVAAFREPLMSLMIQRLHHLGIASRVVAVHGRVDYDFEAFRSRLDYFPGLKILELTAYDVLMPLVGETYRAVHKLPQAKLLLHAPTLFQMEALKGKKPRLWGKYLMIENDEKLLPTAAMQKWGNPLNPVDVYRFAQARNMAKMVFDTAHFWRMWRDKSQRDRLWQEFTETAHQKLPIYWHLNRADDEWFWIDRSNKEFATENDAWLAEVCAFAGKRVREGQDQICFEEPRRLLLRLSASLLLERKRGIGRAIKCLKNYMAL